MTENRSPNPKRSVYSYIAATTLCVGSILYFAQDEEGWVRPLRVILLFTALAAFAVEGWRLNEKRRQPQRDEYPDRLGWLAALIMGWLLLGIAVGELFDQPGDLPRIAVRLALAGLLTGSFVWLFARLERGR